MIKLLHAADLHLDSPFSHLPPEQGARRRQEQRECLALLPGLCQKEQCDVVLLAGDLFDTRQVYRETWQALQSALEACQVPVFLAPGNHDAIGPDSPYCKGSWPDNVHIFTSTEIETVDLGAFTVSGAAFCGSELPSLAGYTAPADGRTHLMVLHGEVSNTESPYRTATPAQVAASKLSYLALGHIHQRGARRTATGTTYAWPGCMMGRGFDETGSKGVYLVEVAESSVQVRFLHCSAPRYEILDVPVTELDQLCARLPADSRRHHYRIRLTGIGPAPDLAPLQRKLAPLTASVQLEDLTQAPLRQVTAQEDTLAGLFVQQIQAAMETAADDAQRETLTLAMELGLQALEGREVTLP